MTDLPVSERMKPRPVLVRQMNRQVFGSPPLPPSDEEKHDAVLVLSDPDMQELEPELFLEATRIFEEASR